MAKAPWVDQDECISCELCITNIPEVFRLAVNGKAECYNPNGATEKEIQASAIDICPVQCIHWAGIADE
jgi:ferredoxin